MLSHKKIMVIAVCCLLAGCSRGIKEGLYAVTGSSGKVVILQGDEAEIAQLARQYGSVTVQPFVNDVGPVCPDEFLSTLPGAIEQELRYRSASFGETMKGKKGEELGPFLTGAMSKSLAISGTVIQYETSGTADKALGPMEEAICRVEVRDGQTNALLVKANCTGRVKSSVRTGAGEMAQGVGKAIRKLLKPADE